MEQDNKRTELGLHEEGQNHSKDIRMTEKGEGSDLSGMRPDGMKMQCPKVTSTLLVW